MVHIIAAFDIISVFNEDRALSRSLFESCSKLSVAAYSMSTSVIIIERAPYHRVKPANIKRSGRQYHLYLDLHQMPCWGVQANSSQPSGLELVQECSVYEE